MDELSVVVEDSPSTSSSLQSTSSHISNKNRSRGISEAIARKQSQRKTPLLTTLNNADEVDQMTRSEKSKNGGNCRVEFFRPNPFDTKYTTGGKRRRMKMKEQTEDLPTPSSNMCAICSMVVKDFQRIRLPSLEAVQRIDQKLSSILESTVHWEELNNEALICDQCHSKYETTFMILNLSESRTCAVCCGLTSDFYTIKIPSLEVVRRLDKALGSLLENRVEVGSGSEITICKQHFLHSAANNLHLSSSHSPPISTVSDVSPTVPSNGSDHCTFPSSSVLYCHSINMESLSDLCTLECVVCGESSGRTINLCVINNREVAKYMDLIFGSQSENCVINSGKVYVCREHVECIPEPHHLFVQSDHKLKNLRCKRSCVVCGVVTRNYRRITSKFVTSQLDKTYGSTVTQQLTTSHGVPVCESHLLGLSRRRPGPSTRCPTVAQESIDFGFLNEKRGSDNSGEMDTVDVSTVDGVTNGLLTFLKEEAESSDS